MALARGGCWQRVEDGREGARKSSLPDWDGLTRDHAACVKKVSRSTDLGPNFVSGRSISATSNRAPTETNIHDQRERMTTPRVFITPNGIGICKLWVLMLFRRLII